MFCLSYEDLRDIFSFFGYVTNLAYIMWHYFTPIEASFMENILCDFEDNA